MKLPENLAHKTIVITGATSGIGQAAARTLAGRGARVVGVGRSPERCAAAEQAIRASHPGAQVTFLAADLSSQRQVRQLAATLRAEHAQLDVLVNNAGTVSSWHTTTEDGYELQFAVNHLAPFLLTHELLPLVRAAPAGRVITVSSGSHLSGKLRWEDVMHRTGYSILKAYNQSKLANVLFSLELNRRGVRAFAVDPGLVATDIGLKGTGALARWMWRLRRGGGISADDGAATIVFLASEPAVALADAVYWKDCRPAEPSHRARDLADAARLWRLSERLCGINKLQEAI